MRAWTPLEGAAFTFGDREGCFVARGLSDDLADDGVGYRILIDGVGYIVGSNEIVGLG